MNPIINEIHNLLTKKGKSISVAESCSGGILCEYLTELSGSSKFFKFGLVTYSNQAKVSLLKIPSSLILRKGAVSKEIAKLMAKNVRKIAKTDFALSITGIAGPGGATPGKAVGTVFIALDCSKLKICKRYFFGGNRTTIRKQSALKALQLLKSAIG